MKAAYIKDRTVELVERPRPVPEAGEVLVRTRLAGICRTDVELFLGYYGFEGVPGHEFVGVVENAPGNGELSGRRVVADINVGCGVCDFCGRGERRHCPGRKVIGIKDWDGAFAGYLKVPATNLYVVDDGIADEAAVFAEPLAAALRISSQVDIRPGMRAAVLGDGKLGLLAALALRARIPDPVLIGKHEDRLALAKKLGLDAAGIEEAGRLGPFDLVVEATGRPEGIRRALELVGPLGTVAVKTTSHLPSRIDLADVVVREVTLIGSRCGDIGQALEFLANGSFDPGPLIEAVYPFDRFVRAFDHARRPGSGKVLLRFD